MNRTGRFANEQGFTTGEKALVIMLVAGVFGYWAGFRVSTPGDVVGMPVAAAAALPDVAQSSPAKIVSDGTRSVRVVAPAPARASAPAR